MSLAFPRRRRRRQRPDFLTDGDFRFQFNLARELHIGTVAEMRRRLSNREFEEWKILYKIEAKEAKKKEGKPGSRGRRR